DHIEATVSVISWLGVHGHLLYPDWQDGDMYEAPYGPLLFIMNGLILWSVHTILGSKIVGWITFVVALSLTVIALRMKALHTRRVYFLLLVSVILMFFLFANQACWNRPEPFLILVCILTIIAALKLPRAAAATAIGVLAGVAVGFKFTGFLY